jgi:hypothetical protein
MLLAPLFLDDFSLIFVPQHYIITPRSISLYDKKILTAADNQMQYCYISVYRNLNFFVVYYIPVMLLAPLFLDDLASVLVLIFSVPHILLGELISSRVHVETISYWLFIWQKNIDCGRQSNAILLYKCLSQSKLLCGLLCHLCFRGCGWLGVLINTTECHSMILLQVLKANMKLSPRELESLLVHQAGCVAQRRTRATLSIGHRTKTK